MSRKTALASAVVDAAKVAAAVNVVYGRDSDMSAAAMSAARSVRDQAFVAGNTAADIRAADAR